MNEWYFPITILPAVALIIMSTTHLASNLSIEISSLIKEDCESDRRIIQRKIEQLTRLSISLSFLYVSSALLVFSGLINGISELPLVAKICLYISVVFILAALIYLIIYSVFAVIIKKSYFKSKL